MQLLFSQFEARDKDLVRNSNNLFTFQKQQQSGPEPTEEEGVRYLVLAVKRNPPLSSSRVSHDVDASRVDYSVRLEAAQHHLVSLLKLSYSSLYNHQSNVHEVFSLNIYVFIDVWMFCMFIYGYICAVVA